MLYGFKDRAFRFVPLRQLMPPKIGVKTNRTTISCHLHNLIFSDTHESLCSRGYRLQGKHRFWRAWVVVFGKRHCEASWRYYHESKQD
jgi:hypothetical protein